MRDNKDTMPNIREEFIITCLLTILSSVYFIWLRRIPSTAKLFLLFNVLWFLKLSINKKGYRVYLPKFFSSTLFIISISVITFIISYFTDNIRPNAKFEKGWFGWWDQSQYLLMAQDFSDLKLVAEHYLYGIGYPLIGAFFVKIYPTNPFFIPNTVLFVLTILLYYNIAKKYLSDELSVLAILLLIWGSQFTNFFVVPWNNIVSTVGLAAVIYTATAVRKIRDVHAINLGIVLGWVFAARYVDVFFLMPIVGYIYLRENIKARENIRHILLTSSVALIILIVVLYTHEYAFGSFFKTPYTLHLQAGGHSDQSLSAYQLSRVPDHLYSIIVNPYQFHYLNHEKLNTPLLGYSFFFILSLAGFAYSIICLRDKVIIVTLVNMLLYTIFYGSFTSTNASDLKYHCLRYFLMWYPILTIMAVLALSKFTRFTQLLKTERKAVIIGFTVTCLLLISTYVFLWSASWNARKNMIDSSRWRVSSNYNVAAVKYAIDNSQITRWDSAEPQKPGMYYEVDFGDIIQAKRVKLRLGDSLNDYPKGIDVEISVDAKAWRKVASIQSVSPPLLTDDSLEFNLSSTQARYLRFIQTGVSDSNYWSIHELEVYK